MSKQRRTFRYWLQQLHLWIGLILLLPLVMMGVTGAVLVYGHDIEHLLGQGEPPARTAGEWRSAGELAQQMFDVVAIDQYRAGHAHHHQRQEKDQADPEMELL